MHSVISSMLERYSIESIEDRENALKEILQKICLVGLWRSHFFDKAAFYGGTALRIFYGLQRFSEDLDFTLLTPNETFRWQDYKRGLTEELEALGLKVSFKEKAKRALSPIKSAFLKTETYAVLLEIGATEPELFGIHKHADIKIKVEIDSSPEIKYTYEQKYLATPLSAPVRCVTKECLFAGKTDAAFFRAWKNRVKGRDWYDFAWFIQNKIPLNLELFSKFLKTETPLTQEAFFQLAHEKIEALDINKAIEDIAPFVSNDAYEMWSHDYFRYWLDKIQFC